MSDINELIHVIRLAERLAEVVAREFGNTTRIREHLASARIRADELASDEGVDLIEDHAILDDRLRRAMTAIAKAGGLEIKEDPYADLPETEVEFDDGKVVRLKASEADLRTLAVELRKAEATEKESLSVQLKRANLKLAEAKLAAQQNEALEADLRYVFSIDPALRDRVREMIDARNKVS